MLWAELCIVLSSEQAGNTTSTNSIRLNKFTIKGGFAIVGTAEPKTILLRKIQGSSLPGLTLYPIL